VITDVDVLPVVAAQRGSDDDLGATGAEEVAQQLIANDRVIGCGAVVAGQDPLTSQMVGCEMSASAWYN